MSKQTKKVTLNGLADKVDKLAATMEAGFKRMDTGFKRVDNKMDAGFKKAEKNRESLARMIANGFEDVTAKMATKDDIVILQNDVSDMKLRVDSLAPYFEVKHLERRVKRLEDRAGIRNAIQH